MNEACVPCTDSPNLNPLSCSHAVSPSIPDGNRWGSAVRAPDALRCDAQQSSCVHGLRVECAVVFVWVWVFMKSELASVCVRVGVGVYDK